MTPGAETRGISIMESTVAFRSRLERWVGILLFALLGPFVFPAGPANAQSAQLRPVTLSLDFIVLGRFAPWYVAVAKNYYRDAGLDVKIVPSQGTAQSVQALEAG